MIESWLADLEARHLAALTFPEVRRALEALSLDYVARRERVLDRSALAGRGKRAAFALFYGPLHFFLVREIVRALGCASPAPREIVDLGCGTGVAGAAWAIEAGGARVRGVDRHGWALEEARRAWRALGVAGRASRGDAATVPLPEPGGAAIAAFTLNEMDPAARERLIERLLDAAARGVGALVVEPIAKGPVPWWAEAERRLVAAGGRTDAWRFAVGLPDLQARLSHAAGLDHRVLTARSLFLPLVSSAA